MHSLFRREEVRARLSREEYTALMQLCATRGLSQADLIRSLITGNAVQDYERTAAPEIAVVRDRVEALHARLGGIEKALLAAIHEANRTNQDVLTALHQLIQFVVPAVYGIESIIQNHTSAAVKSHVAERLSAWQQQAAASPTATE